jgi:DNA polymerase-3 subunit epsilon
MNLKLERPLAFFDLETTGVTVGADRIVEISILKVFPDGKKDVKTHRVNPEMQIPEHVSEIHGIYNQDVANEPTFEQLAPNLYLFLNDCDLAGFNSNKFDIPVLVEEFYRVGYDFDVMSRKWVDVQNIFHKMEQRTLVAAYKFYCDKDLTGAHSAEADIKATYEVLLAQLERYDELENNVDFLHEFSRRGNHADLTGRLAYNEQKEIVFNFGKHKGKLVVDVLSQEPSYYSWMMKGDFSQTTKAVLKRIKLSMKNA